MQEKERQTDAEGNTTTTWVPAVGLPALLSYCCGTVLNNWEMDQMLLPRLAKPHSTQSSKT